MAECLWGRSERLRGAIKLANPGYKPGHTQRVSAHADTHTHSRNGTVTFLVGVA